MKMRNKKVSIIILISSIGLIILGLNQIFELFELINSKTSSILIILFSVLNFIFILKLNNINDNKESKSE
ncbi:hypothetical protein DSM00_2542 [Leeuwenhoekiella aequorea]|uniref:Uncharacterized protein n=1 Tax=Leeuwenhoekiella aequorea TaxID=283736 RepID=A0A4Q0P4J7_9FLAO|nr:hypothetical protein [uncultured bacterium]RXG21028.1 hypothetical protein DSM00_2542 [Leeuwenhoekiella aequorea]